MTDDETIRCPHCRGTGRVPLPEHLARTLDQLRVLPGATVKRLAIDFPGVGETAINNHLEDLRRLGYVQRQSWGREWLYTSAEPQKEARP
jgi:hypothetical protein